MRVDIDGNIWSSGGWVGSPNNGVHIFAPDGSGALVGSASYDAFGAIRSQSGTTSALGYTGEQYTPATGLLHLRARDLNPVLGRFLSVDTVQPNAPGSQGFNLYAYTANNPTTWIDPSGHNTLDAAADIGSFILAGRIAYLLSLARIPELWRSPNHARMAQMTFDTFALILWCFSLGPCRAGTMENTGIIHDNGSDSAGGRRSWTLPDLLDLPSGWPTMPDWDWPWPGGWGGGNGGNNPGGAGGGNGPGGGGGGGFGGGGFGGGGFGGGFGGAGAGAGAGAGTGPIGPLLGGCLLGGVMNGLADLAFDAYGYENTLGNNAGIAAGVMYNVVTCGGAGGAGGSSGGSGSGGSNNCNNGACIPWIDVEQLPRLEREAVFETVDQIEGRLPPPLPGTPKYRRWGAEFRNWRNDLPTQLSGYYHEYTVLPQGAGPNRGPLRIVTGASGEFYYTWTHYGDSGAPAFVRIR